MLSKLTDWFLYDRGYHHERVKHSSGIIRMRILNPLRYLYFYSSGRNALSKRTANKKKYVKLENDPGQVIGPNQQFEEKNSA